MVGALVTSFCEREENAPIHALELWVYPDSTLNLVMVKDEQGEQEEYAFPCGLHQLQAVIDGRPMEFCHENGSVFLRKVGENVCADFVGEGAGWRQCIDSRSFEEALDASMASFVA